MIASSVSVALSVATLALADETAANWTTWVASADVARRVDATAARARLGFDSAAGGTTLTAAVIERWGKPAPAIAWNDVALDLIKRYQKNPLRAARALTLLHVAVYDAAVVSVREQLAPAGRRIAMHAAAAHTLEYLFPQEPPGRFGALGRAAAYATVAAQPRPNEELAKAWAIGQAVATQVVARGLADGADAVWNSRDRHAAAPGIWLATPPLHIHHPLEPRAGRWRTWVLRDGGEIQPLPPVTYDSDSYWAEVKEVLDVTRALTAEQKRVADDWNLDKGTVTPAGVWNLHARDAARAGRLDEAHTARLLAAVNVAMMDAFISAWRAKFTHWTQRPITAIRDRFDKEFLPYIITPPFPSYVSGHATVSGAAAGLLAGWFPARASEFRAHAAEAARSRLYGGIHFTSDNEQGLQLGRDIGKRVAQYPAAKAP